MPNSTNASSWQPATWLCRWMGRLTTRVSRLLFSARAISLHSYCSGFAGSSRWVLLKSASCFTYCNLTNVGARDHSGQHEGCLFRGSKRLRCMRQCRDQLGSLHHPGGSRVFSFHLRNDFEPYFLYGGSHLYPRSEVQKTPFWEFWRPKPFSKGPVQRAAGKQSDHHLEGRRQGV